MKIALYAPLALSLLVSPASFAADEQATITIMASRIGTPAMDQAADLADALEDSGTLRIVPVAGSGPVQSLTDLLQLKGIDAAIIPADTVAFAEKQELLPGIAKRVSFVGKTGSTDIIVLARPNIAALTDLRDKRVSLGGASEQRYVSGSMLFAALDIPVAATEGSETDALSQLRRGEIDAMVIAGGRLASLDDGSGIKLLPVPITAEIENTYSPQILTAADYPGLIKDGEAVETISVATVVAVLNWKPGSARHKAIKALSSAMFENAALLHAGPRRADWSNINLAADVPGWSRHDLAVAWLEQSKQTAAKSVPKPTMSSAPS